MDDQTDDELSRIEARIDELARKLPRDLSFEPDLWPRICARIDTPAESRFRRLPRTIAPARDLWPEIEASLSAKRAAAGAPGPWQRPRREAAGVAGVVAVTVLATLLAAQLLSTVNIDPAINARVASVSPELADQLPPRLMESLSPARTAPAGTLAAEIQATANLIRRDFEMVRNERLRIEQALTDSANDMNLREQWRHVYVAELRLISEIENLGNLQLTRSEI